MQNIELEIKNFGFAIADRFFNSDILEKAENDLKHLKAFDYESVSAINSGNLLKNSKTVFEIATDPKLVALLSRMSDRKLFPVKAFILDKTSKNNWEIPWHQDLKIALAQKAEVEGFANWTVEAGIPHVQPPLHILEELITIRIHLDSCNANNGAIYVVPGSHKQGIINEDTINSFAQCSEVRLCEVNKMALCL